MSMMPGCDTTSFKRSACLVFGVLFLAVLCAFPAIDRALAVQATTVSTEDELRAAVAKGSAAGDIKLGANITLGSTLDFSQCVMQGESSSKTLTIDLNGHDLILAPTHADSDAVIVVPADYTFTLRDNSGTNAGSVTGGACGIVNNGTFTLATGGIRNNGGSCDGAGIRNNDNAVLTITGGIIENNAVSKGFDGAGIYNRGQIQMTGGFIQNNKANASSGSQGRGGGIYNAAKGNLTILGGTIQGNSAWRGGGVYNKPDCEVMVFMNKAAMINNTATESGGGIYNAEGSKEMKLAIVGGTISGNTSGGNGGGIATPGIMAASDGVIENNTADGRGGGIYVSGELSLSDSIKVQNNKGAKGFEDDTYLTSDKRIIIEAPFSRKAHVGVACEDHDQIFTKNYEKYHEGVDPNTFFFANPCCYQEDVRILWGDGDVGARNLRCLIVIHYQDVNGIDRECTDYKDVKKKDDDWGEWDETTWYVVRHDTDLNEYAKVEGNVNLILCTDATLKTGGIGILRKSDKGDRAKLTIWNSTGDPGYLIADSDDWGDGHAGIGFKKNSGGVGSLVINGGNIIALGGGDAAGIGGVENRGNGPITINGGYVEAHGGKWGAGIGGGQGGNQDNPIKINGGTVKAYGGKYAAGIGGGDSDRGGADGGKVVIKNATVYAEGGSRGAGIGGGEDGEGCNVTIENSTVEAHGGGKGAGIGGGQDSESGGTLTVESGTVKAYGGYEAAGIGGGEDSCGGTFIANGGTIFALAGDGCANSIGAGHGDYHEGTMKLYDRAKVTSSKMHTETPTDVRPANERLNGLTWHSVLIEPCDHPAGATYTDVSPVNHKVDTTCVYCGLVQGEAREETHHFDDANHTCVCGHTEAPIVLMRDDEATEPMRTDYQSSGSTYKLPYMMPRGVEWVFDNWKVSGVKDIADGTVMEAGDTFLAVPASDSSQIMLTAQWKATGACLHEMQHYPAKEATCTEDGNIEYWQCTKCNRLYLDEKGNNETTGESITIEALGHDWSEATYEWAPDYSHCTGRHSCQRDGCSAAESAESIFVMGPITKEASCIEEGGEYYLAIFMTLGFSTQRKDISTTPVDPGKHDWAEPTYVWSEDYSTCTATRICENDKTHVETETVTSRSEESQLPCKTYTAEFVNPAFSTQTVSGHLWGEAKYFWSADCTTCTATRVCVNDPSHVDTVTVDARRTVISPPTCTETGAAFCVASFDDAAFTPQVKFGILPATGHRWSEQWETVKEATQDATGLRRRACLNDSSHTQELVIPKLNHNHSLDYIAGEEASCDKSGIRAHWKCSDAECGALFADEGGTAGAAQITEDDIVIAPLGHDWLDPRYSWGDDNMTCVAMHVCSRVGLHFQIEAAQVTKSVNPDLPCSDPAKLVYTATFKNGDFSRQVKTEQLEHAWGAWQQTKEPTCEETGEETRTCSVCGDKETRAVEAVGHSWGKWTVVKPATRDEDGLEERVCKSDSSHVDSRVIPRTTHVHGLTKVEAKAPTCTEPGNCEYWVCTTGAEPCHRFFADATATRSLSEEEIEVPPLGHSWGETVYDWNEDNTVCTASHVCTRDGSHTESETVETIAKVSSPATCIMGGKVTYTASFQNKTFAPQIKIAKTAKLGHTPVTNPVRKNVVDPSCTTPGSYDSVTTCATCGKEISVSSEKTAPLGHNWEIDSTADCTHAGVETHSCTRCDTVWQRDVPATGHSWGDWELVTAPTDTAEGSEQRVCNNDPSHIETRSIPRLSHTHNLELVDAVDPGCEPGRIKHWKCTDPNCNRLFSFDDPSQEINVEDTIVPPCHAWNDGEVTTAPTCTGQGQRVYTCTSCGVTRTEVLEATGHVSASWSQKDFQAPGCLAHGLAWKTLRCDSCKEVMLLQLLRTDPKGHDWDDWVVVQEATETTEGQTTRVCKNDSSHTETIYVPAKGHAWGEPSYEWSDDCSFCTATHVCAVCGKSETETVRPISMIAKLATCTEEGKTTYTATFANTSFASQTKTLVDIDPLGHDWSEWVETTPMTEDAAGVETRTCSRCGKTETRAITVDILYRAIDGDGDTWTKGSGEVLDFTFKRAFADGQTFDRFTGIEVDGQALPETDSSGKANWTVKKGSLILSLQPSFLETLSEGGHTVRALFDDGSAEASFNIASNAGGSGGKTALAKTMDSLKGAFAILAILAVIAGACLVCSGVLSRKRRGLLGSRDQ